MTWSAILTRISLAVIVCVGIVTHATTSPVTVHAIEVVKEYVEVQPTGYLVDAEAECMAKNLYFEARGEKEAGIKAVFSVTMNRVRSDNFPNSVCDVVYQKAQFSWTEDHISNNPKNGDEYMRMYKYATGLKVTTDTVDGADHYYSHKKVTPYWSESMTVIALIGNHTFGAFE